MKFAAPFGDPSTAPPPGITLREVLEVETLDDDLFRAPYAPGGNPHLYGGQVIAQALRAAGLTVPAERTPHSLHGYFIRAGDTSAPVILRVHADRDGRSFSARRVEAVQHGEVILSLSCSFTTEPGGVDHQVAEAPSTLPPEECPTLDLPRLVSFDARELEQPYEEPYWPVRFWARLDDELEDDPLLHACVLAYLSDISSGIAPLSRDGWRPGSSLDHALWFHRPSRADAWHLLDLTPVTVAGERGWYTGGLYDTDGRLVASTVQECLFRASR